MKKRFLTLAAFALLFAGLNSCSKNDPVVALTDQQGVSTEIKAKITALGFDAEEAYPVEGGYIVEGDIFLSDEDLNKPIDLVRSLLIADEEQYHTTNLVENLPRNITVRVVSTLPQSIHTATDNAIARYNAEGLQITFSKVTSGGDIVIKKAPNGAQYIASAGFPSGGNPYNQVLFNTKYSNWNANTLTSILAHEVGHCIGFRHTDYMNRSYSCGGTPVNEGDGGVGAIHIPGTPTGPDAASWMLACIGNGTNRPFNANDKIALGFLY
ncbi:MAG: hypothetical protein JNN28_20985 [Saprospiraceae bacterium]|nr:hypothetical protein [Saprospiraceae bacterium]